MTESNGDIEQLRRFEALTDSALAHLDLESLLEELLERVSELLKVDTAVVLLLDKGTDELVATATKGLEREVRLGIRVKAGEGFAGRVFASRQPVVVEHVDTSSVVSPIIRSQGIQSLLGVPLVVSGEIIGVLNVGSRQHRRFGESDTQLLQTVADRVALATQARRADVERVATAVLQRSLLPERLPTVPGLELASRYLPSAGVGGDWYDVFPLPGGLTGVAIGDVVGRGLPAAVVMGRLRNALRAYALETSDPAEVLERLDRKAHHFEAGQMTTVLYMVLEPESPRVTLSSAGHLLPLKAMPSGAVGTVDAPVDPPLAVVEAAVRRTSAVTLPEGALMLLFTDGVVERRGEVLTEGLERLRGTVSASHPSTVCADVLLSMLDEQVQLDDIALLALRRTRTGS